MIGPFRISGGADRLLRGSRALVSARPYRWAAAALVVLLGATAGASAYTANVARNQARQRVDRDAALAVRTLDRRLVAYGEVLVAVRGLFEIDPHPSRRRFAQFVGSLQLDERYPGVRVVSFARAVDAANLASLTRDVRRDSTARAAGYPPFTVHPLGRQTRLMVLDYLEPVTGNEPALGLDLLGDPIRARAIEITQSTGRPAATAPLRLIQDPKRRKAFVFMLAVRNAGGPLTSARTGRLTGVVTAAFGFDDLLEAILGDRTREADFEVYDVGESASAARRPPSRANAIYNRDGSLQAPLDTRPLHALIPINVGGRRWLVYFAPRGALASTPGAGVPWIVAAGGTLASLLAAWLLLTLARGRAVALALAGRMTRDLKRSEKLLERRRDQLVEAQSVGGFGSWEWDIAAGTIEWSEELSRIYGVEPGAQRSFEEFLALAHPDDRARLQATVQTAYESHQPFSFEHRVVRADGVVRVLHGRGQVITDDAGRPLRMLGTGQDITERTQMEQALRDAEERFRTAFEGAPIGVCLMSLDAADPGRLLQANPALAEILGVSVQDLTGVPVSSLTHPEDHADIYAHLTELIDGRSSHVELEKRFMHRNGHPVWAVISAAPLPAAAGQPAVAVTHVMDISDRKQFEGQLQHLADHDALTGLFNRRRFSEELERALKHAKRFGEDVAVLFLDLDGFKFVNDTLGHAAGDELITQVAGLLSGTLRETDTVARAGGDEFAVLLPGTDQASAVLVAEKLLSTLRRSTATGGDDRSARVSSSIGIALFSGGDELTADGLVAEADIAMYAAKEAGKDRYAIYERTEGRRELMSIRENWNERLRAAVRDDSFVLQAQPIVPICSSGTQAFELLLRLPDDHGDLIPPGTFLYNAESFGLIEQIDRWVLRETVRHLSASHAAGTDLMLTVNVSGKSMGDRTLGGYVAALLAEHAVRPQRLVIEITETAAITNIERARTLAQELQTLGCQLALDDFGAGFASFYYLKHLKFDYLKIDGEFIRNLCATPTDQLVVQAVVSIAHGLNTWTIAKFVGDDATLELLHKLGVDYGQGYHLGRPAALDQTLPYLIDSRSAAGT